MIKSTKGFTLIELLVVIAIIGILSGVVLTSLNSARGKARVAQAQTSLSAIQKTALICMDATAIPPDLVQPPAGAQPVAGAALCATESAWPALPSSAWSWGTAAASCSGTAPDYTVTDGTFRFCATGDGKTIACTQTGCVTS